ncbi:MAG: hypothetical protein COV59_05385 [Candidatus Magasanikbacteria bacterium CG11_big_fil_rev_8_21_14_0_20_39_34]|uniref:Transcriptional repressor n=1 Tax=Candidatus Magasanikbacteria bacterium CG11_big_fil_rev_8_21_14_0_20_39_34 TaxID=1974653 RepID=A0A2H0N3W7_9BACT|nr:MAG: hypothetical protein COV59_05385 [Candidatus Magasanikbacteria bacterium CG11_big_fil_rev_8_21_14_0_20_39_34]
MKTQEEIILQLKEKGYRSSNARNILLEAVYESREPLSVADFQKIFAKRKVKVNRTTIYRELNLLKKESVLIELQLKDGKRRYELEDRAHHHHIVCIRCQKVEDVMVCHTRTLIGKVLKQAKNFSEIVNHTSDFFGLCKKCVKS